LEVDAAFRAAVADRIEYLAGTLVPGGPTPYAKGFTALDVKAALGRGWTAVTVGRLRDPEYGGFVEVEKLIKISEAMGCTLDWLIVGREAAATAKIAGQLRDLIDTIEGKPVAPHLTLVTPATAPAPTSHDPPPASPVSKGYAQPATTGKPAKGRFATDAGSDLGEATGDGPAKGGKKPRGTK
jgi:hypothetical protein